MKDEFDSATAAEEKVVLLSHVPLNDKSHAGTCMVWDLPEVMELMKPYSCIKAVLCGHDHAGGYAKDAQGVHHVTFHSPLNCKKCLG